MKFSIVFFVCLFAFFFLSCKKEGCSDANASNFDSKVKRDDGSCVYPEPSFNYSLSDEPTFSFDFDGNYLSLTNGVGDVELHSSSYKNFSGGNSHAVVYSTFYHTGNSPQYFSISKGILEYPGSWLAPESDFFSFFQSNTYPFDIDQSEEGIIISYTMSNGVNYISNLGNQNGSSFEILQSSQQEVNGNQSMKVLVAFNCKMYNSADPTDVKLITNGQVVTHFINF